MEKGTTMRSRGPSFVMIGLVIVNVILAFNYWSINTQNGQLSSELETARVEITAISEKHSAVEKRAATIATQLLDSDKKLKAAEMSVAEKEEKQRQSESEVQSLKTQLQQANQQTEGARKDADRIQQEKNSVSGELEKVTKELTELKNAPKVCDTNACKEPIRDIIASLTKNIGKPAIAGALKDKVEVMQMAGDLLPDENQDKPQSEADKVAK